MAQTLYAFTGSGKKTPAITLIIKTRAEIYIVWFTHEEMLIHGQE